MKTNYYIFIDKFVASCDIETAYHYIRQIEEYPRWWGKVYKKIIKLKEAPPDVAGAKYRITVGGFLPYSLTIDNEVTHIDRPNLIRFDAEGELKGKGVWSFREVGEGTEVTFDWRVAANKKVIRLFSFFFHLKLMIFLLLSILINRTYRKLRTLLNVISCRHFF